MTALSPVRAVSAHFAGYGRTLVVGSDTAEVDKVSQLTVNAVILFVHFPTLSAVHILIAVFVSLFH